jgi:hypothetical protein
VHTPQLVPDSLEFTSTWNELAVKNGFDGIYFIGIHYLGWDHHKDGYDDKTIHQPTHYVQVYERIKKNRLQGMIQRNLFKCIPDIYNYRDLVKHYDFGLFDGKDFIPTILPNWDNTPRSGKRGWVFHRSTPEAFGEHLDNALQYVLKRPESKPRILFIKSWNEWAEGNYLEPDMQWGRGYLEAIREVIKKNR